MRTALRTPQSHLSPGSTSSTPSVSFHRETVPAPGQSCSCLFMFFLHSTNTWVTLLQGRWHFLSKSDYVQVPAVFMTQIQIIHRYITAFLKWKCYASVTKGQCFLREQVACSSILKSFDLLMIMKLVVTSSGPTRSYVSAGCSKIITLHGAVFIFKPAGEFF